MRIPNYIDAIKVMIMLAPETYESKTLFSSLSYWNKSFVSFRHLSRLLWRRLS